MIFNKRNVNKSKLNYLIVGPDVYHTRQTNLHDCYEFIHVTSHVRRTRARELVRRLKSGQQVRVSEDLRYAVFSIEF